MISFPLPVPVPLPRVTITFAFIVVVWKRSFCVLHSEVFILATSPQSLHFIIIVWISIWVTIYRISEFHFISDDAIAALSEEIIFFVKFSLVLSDGHIETLLLKVRLLLLTDGGLLQHLFGMP